MSTQDKLAEALRTLEAAAINGVVLHGDDIPRLHATVNRIAPLTAEAVQAQPQAAEPVAFKDKGNKDAN